MAPAWYELRQVEEGYSSEELLSVDPSAAGPELSPAGRCGRRGALASATLGFSALALIAFTSARSAAQPRHAGVESHVGLFGFSTVAGVAEGLVTGGGSGSQLGSMIHETRENVRNSKAANVDKLVNLTGKQLFPKERMHDGNVCADDEESFGGVCFAKCGVLTGGAFPVRTTAWSCCAAEPCTFFNSKFTSPLRFCSGFDVSGPRENLDCPHAPGTCLANEEFNLGMCFKKCGILTNNTHPFRSAASTCCRYNSHLACLDALNVVTAPGFDVGGGDGKLTPNTLHVPMPELTEA